MPRVRPRSATYELRPTKKRRAPERSGQLVVGPATKRLALLLATPRTAVDTSSTLDRLEEARAESTAFIRAMTEGEE